MSEYIDIVRDKITQASFRPTNPKHWIVRIIQDDAGNMTEFKRGGILTEHEAHKWALTLVEDYPDAVEIVLYELTNAELNAYKAKGWV